MSLKEPVSRRQFLIGFALAGTGVGLTSLWNRSGVSRILGANDRIRAAVIGLGLNGSRQLGEYLRLPGVEIAALCDIDEHRLLQSAQMVSKRGQPPPITTRDFRRILDSQEIDAISIATPARLHGGIAIAACEAGKDVYVEKPCSTNFSEGKRLVAAAEKYGRIVQQRMGTNFAVSHDSLPLLTSPTLSEVQRVSGAKVIYGTDLEAARDVPANGYISQSHYQLIADAFDEWDFARAMLEVGLPTQVSAVSLDGPRRNGWRKVGIQMLFNSPGKDQRALDFQLETRPNASNHAHSNGSDGPPLYFESFNRFITHKGDFMVTSDSRSSDHQIQSDLINFLSRVRDRRQHLSNFPIAEAQTSCALVQLAQLSLNHRRTLAFDPESERVVGDDEMNAGLALDPQ